MRSGSGGLAPSLAPMAQLTSLDLGNNYICAAPVPCFPSLLPEPWRNAWHSFGRERPTAHSHLAVQSLTGSEQSKAKQRKGKERKGKERKGNSQSSQYAWASQVCKKRERRTKRSKRA